MTDAALDFRKEYGAAHLRSANGGASSYPRSDKDWYVEPRWAVEALLDAERFRGEIWDPACGSGNIVTACRERGLEPAWGSDIVARGFGGPAMDFLEREPFSEGEPDNPANIICNPPFSLAQRFIDHALKHATHKVAMLVRLAFLEGQARKPFFEAAPLKRVLVFSRRVSMPPGGMNIEAKGGGNSLLLARVRPRPPRRAAGRLAMSSHPIIHTASRRSPRSARAGQHRRETMVSSLKLGGRAPVASGAAVLSPRG